MKIQSKAVRQLRTAYKQEVRQKRLQHQEGQARLCTRCGYEKWRHSYQTSLLDPTPARGGNIGGHRFAPRGTQ